MVFLFLYASLVGWLLDFVVLAVGVAALFPDCLLIFQHLVQHFAHLFLIFFKGRLEDLLLAL